MNFKPSMATFAGYTKRPWKQEPKLSSCCGAELVVNNNKNHCSECNKIEEYNQQDVDWNIVKQKEYDLQVEIERLRQKTAYDVAKQKAIQDQASIYQYEKMKKEEFIKRYG